MNFHALPVWANAAIFAVAAGLIWFGGFRLSVYGDAIAERKNWGRAFVGALLLGVVTSLPEVATSVTAAAIGNPALAVNNLMGGIAMQVAVLAAVDLFFVRGALTFFSPQPVLLMSGVLVVFQLALTLAAMAAGEFASILGVGLWPLLLMAVYILSLHFLYRYEGRGRWVAADIPDESYQGEPSEAELFLKQHDGTLGRLYLWFGAYATLVLIGGYAASATGDALAVQTGLGASFVGATLIALATSLPEISTTVGAVRVGAYTMAVANIFGTNSLGSALLLVCDIAYPQGQIIETADRSAQFAAAMGILVTCVYLWGLLERRDKTVFGMGVDSALVLLLWTMGLGVLYLLR